jgi:membrane protease YdiL (CAAX protease family)
MHLGRLDPELDSELSDNPGRSAIGTTETRRPFHDRLIALGEVTLCSGFPTQLAVVFLLQFIGAEPSNSEGQLSLLYLIILSLVDATLVLSLVWLLFRVHGEHPRAILLGTRPVGPEVLLGLILVPLALLIVGISFTLISKFAPTLHNIADNPFEALISSLSTAVAFGLVAMLAGGLREEVQRAFILHRFEQHLGGAFTGLIIFSAVFGLGHLVQGRDAAIITGLLGALWGFLYITRRSLLAPLTCHALFNMTEVFIAYSGNSGV